jgi:hypothetical protein
MGNRLHNCSRHHDGCTLWLFTRVLTSVVQQRGSVGDIHFQRVGLHGRIAFRRLTFVSIPQIYFMRSLSTQGAGFALQNFDIRPATLNRLLKHPTIPRNPAFAHSAHLVEVDSHKVKSIATTSGDLTHYSNLTTLKKSLDPSSAWKLRTVNKMPPNTADGMQR